MSCISVHSELFISENRPYPRVCHIAVRQSRTERRHIENNGSSNREHLVCRGELHHVAMGEKSLWCPYFVALDGYFFPMFNQQSEIVCMMHFLDGEAAQSLAELS